VRLRHPITLHAPTPPSEPPSFTRGTFERAPHEALGAAAGATQSCIRVAMAARFGW
jgi:hypothetical protein